jgi:hypothetical protein
MRTVVSLGFDCGPASELQDHKLRIQAYPFDWILTTGGVTKCIVEDFKQFFALVPDGSLDDDGHGPYPTNRYGYQFLHEEGADLSAKATEKYRRRIERFRQVLTKGPVSFVRQSHYARLHSSTDHQAHDEIQMMIDLCYYLDKLPHTLDYRIHLVKPCTSCCDHTRSPRNYHHPRLIVHPTFDVYKTPDVFSQL